MHHLRILFVSFLVSITLTAQVVASQLFENSVVSNDIDFIQSDDFTVPSTIVYLGTARREMPDKRNDILFDDNALVFLLKFDDETYVNVYGHSDFKNSSEVEKYVTMISAPIGKLPFHMRDALDYVVIHKGDATAFAEYLAQFMVLYSDNIMTRVLNHDLEETVFHETVHATLDYQRRNSSEWSEAQLADNLFVTSYGARNPESEDFAESALFAHTLIKHPNRLPVKLENWLVNNIPHRLKYFNELFKELETKSIMLP